MFHALIRPGLASAVIFAAVFLGGGATAGGGCRPSSDEVSQARATREVVVPMSECEFQPTILHVDPGTEITWVNDDLFPHTVTGALMSWGSDLLIQPDDKVLHRFDEEGVYPYYCVLHPGMAGAVVVGEPSGFSLAAQSLETGVDKLYRSEVPVASSGVSPWLAIPLLPIAIGIGYGVAAIRHGRR